METTFVRMASAMSRLEARGKLFAGIISVQQGDNIGIGLEARAFLKNIVRHDEVTVLADQLLFWRFRGDYSSRRQNRQAFDPFFVRRASVRCPGFVQAGVSMFRHPF